MGELIREARLRKGLSREELAVRIGCSYFTLRKWEKGEAVPIRMFRKRLEAELDIDLSGKKVREMSSKNEEKRWEP